MAQPAIDLFSADGYSPATSEGSSTTTGAVTEDVGFSGVDPKIAFMLLHQRAGIPIFGLGWTTGGIPLEGDMDEKIVRIEGGLERLEQKVDLLTSSADKQDVATNARIERVEQRLGERIDNLSSMLWKHLWALLGVFGAGFVLLLGAMAKGFKWF